MKKLEAVLFDLDGTLLDSAHDIAQALSAVLAEAGRAPLTPEEVRPMLGDGMIVLCQKAFIATGGVPKGDPYAWVKRFVEHYRAVPPDQNQVFPGGRELLADLKSKGVKLGICTNKADVSMRHVMSELGLAPLFGFMAGGDTFEVHKPHPGHVLGVLERLDASPEGSIFVGDGPRDSEAARAADVACVLVAHGERGLEALGADAIIDELSDFWAAATKLGFETALS